LRKRFHNYMASANVWGAMDADERAAYIARAREPTRTTVQPAAAQAVADAEDVDVMTVDVDGPAPRREERADLFGNGIDSAVPPPPALPAPTTPPAAKMPTATPGRAAAGDAGKPKPAAVPSPTMPPGILFDGQLVGIKRGRGRPPSPETLAKRARMAAAAAANAPVGTVAVAGYGALAGSSKPATVPGAALPNGRPAGAPPSLPKFELPSFDMHQWAASPQRPAPAPPKPQQTLAMPSLPQLPYQQALQFPQQQQQQPPAPYPQRAAPYQAPPPPPPPQGLGAYTAPWQAASPSSLAGMTWQQTMPWMAGHMQPPPQQQQQFAAAPPAAHQMLSMASGWPQMGGASWSLGPQAMPSMPWAQLSGMPTSLTPWGAADLPASAASPAKPAPSRASLNGGVPPPAAAPPAVAAAPGAGSVPPALAGSESSVGQQSSTSDSDALLLLGMSH